ncbi:Nn.00g069510.m01.CDS01 [Neocucurbitaria sp. VM-36]
MSSKIEKTLQRQREKIAEGQYYEAHQQLRVIASRYTKAQDWGNATSILYSGAQSLLQAGQGGSGGDLCIFLLDVFNKGEVKPDASSKGKLMSLLRAFPKDEPTKKKFVGEMIAWSSKFGEYPAGDPDIHHVAGSLFAEDLEPYDAERHLLLGTQDSASTLASLEYSWYEADDSHTAPLYCARGVLPYLLTGNLRAANKFFLLFTSQLAKKPNLSTQSVSTKSSDVRVYPSLPLLNFLGLLLLSVERGDPSLYRQLKSHYATDLKDVNWNEALDQIGEMYFGIKIPRQGNPMFDMLGSMFGGGMGGGAKKPAPSRSSAPAASRLD